MVIATGDFCTFMVWVLTSAWEALSKLYVEIFIDGIKMLNFASRPSMIID